MAKSIPPSLLSALTALARWLDDLSGPSMVIGGVAASFLGRPRLTQDIDALVILDEDRWAVALDQAAKLGIVPRIEAPLDFARRARVLLLRHDASGCRSNAMPSLEAALMTSLGFRCDCQALRI